jgi:hypothetical protein
MTPLAHHAGADSLVNLLLLGGGSMLPLVTVAGRARLAAARNRLARLLRRQRE